jgi:hypothetical protein
MSSTIDQLAQRLLQATERGRISWATTSNEETFAWSGKSATFLVSYADLDDSGTVEIKVLDKEGTVVELAHYEAHYGGEYEGMFALYEAARRNARGADRIIGDLITEVDKLDPPAPKTPGWGGGYSDEPPF